MLALTRQRDTICQHQYRKKNLNGKTQFNLLKARCLVGLRAHAERELSTFPGLKFTIKSMLSVLCNIIYMDNECANLILNIYDKYYYDILINIFMDITLYIIYYRLCQVVILAIGICEAK